MWVSCSRRGISHSKRAILAMTGVLGERPRVDARAGEGTASYAAAVSWVVFSRSK